jgi:hypothetical protein
MVRRSVRIPAVFRPVNIYQNIGSLYVVVGLVTAFNKLAPGPVHTEDRWAFKL